MNSLKIALKYDLSSHISEYNSPVQNYIRLAIRKPSSNQLISPLWISQLRLPSIHLTERINEDWLGWIIRHTNINLAFIFRKYCICLIRFYHNWLVEPRFSLSHTHCGYFIGTRAVVVLRLSSTIVFQSNCFLPRGLSEKFPFPLVSFSLDMN